MQLHLFCPKSSIYIDRLAQDCGNSIANILELPQSCTKPSTCKFVTKQLLQNANPNQIPSEGCFSVKIPPYHYRNSHYKGKMVTKPCYLYNGKSYNWKYGLYIEKRPLMQSHSKLLVHIYCRQNYIIINKIFFFFQKLTLINSVALEDMSPVILKVGFSKFAE